MKKFKVIWYHGYLTEEPEKDDKFIAKLLEETIVKAKGIDSVSCLSILPKEEKDRYHHYKGGHGYVRGILCDDKNRLFDYGSHTNFVWVKEIE